ncbi:MAG: hypothetical protein II225_00545, partial [Ruminococcus sp.]|nr:hypothetical protein [Ruminococcus sp.]
MKTSKIAARLLSVVLAVMMLFSLVTVGFTASAAEVETAETGASIPAGTYLYLKPNNNWKADGARFAAYFYGNGEAWVSMTQVATGVYRVQSPAGKAYPNVIFCRMNPANTTNNWDNKWNQSADLTWPGGNKNCWAPAASAWDN